MNVTNRMDVSGIGTYPDLIPQNIYVNDINKVYIPFRPILEAELMISGILALKNYEFVSKLPFSSLDADAVIKDLEFGSDHLFQKILERFFIILKRIVPVASELGPNLKDEVRYGNVNAYTESRIPLFYAIDRLKVKLLILRNFFIYLRENNFQLSAFPSYDHMEDKSLQSILFSEYYLRMLKYFRTVVWEPRYKAKYLNTNDDVNFRVLYELHSHQQKSTPSKLGYIVRGLKSSLFITILIFKLCDIPDPFETANGCVEALLLNRDFIPGMINVMDMAYRVADANKLQEMVSMFLNYLDNILEGVNNGIRMASNNQMNPIIEATVYYLGDILD
ncbi:MAG: hypothetical protein E4G98_04455, partial [Promethearchaeota archaeon]